MIDRKAARLAGYGDVDTPCEPRRSAYTDDEAGTVAYATALARWIAYRAFSGAADPDPDDPDILAVLNDDGTVSDVS